VSVLAASIALAAPATAAPNHASSRACTTSASPHVTRYNRTPGGAGPWHVPFDRCNYEGRAMGDHSVPYSDCAYWAAEKRPDVFYGPVNKYGYKQYPYGAWNVAVDAYKGGYRVNHRPQVGDIAAWKSNATMGRASNGMSWYRAARGGHVSYVEAVHGSFITLSDMGHNPNNGGYTFELEYSHTRTYFIHKTHR
jgi:surface antigen